MRSEHDIERAIDAHGDSVWRVCRMRMDREADAQDAFQETFLKFALHEKYVFENEEHERAWLIRVATNECLDVLRSRAHGVERLDESYSETPSPEMGDRPDSALWEVAEALDRLPPEQRQAVYLTVVEGMPATEAASAMGAPINTVYSWVARGKQRLREVLS